MLHVQCYVLSVHQLTDAVLKGNGKQALADSHLLGLRGIDLAPALFFPLWL